MKYTRIYLKLEKCPHCEKVIKLNKIRRFDFLKGSPIRTCPNCKETYFYPEYQELGLVLFADRGDKFAIWQIMLLLLTHIAIISDFFFPARFDFSLKTLLAVGGTIGIAIYLDYSLVQAIKNRIHSEEYHQKQIDYIEGRTKERPLELVKSIERLSNKEYLDALKGYGIDVPDYFYERLNNMHGKIE